jgi:alkylation response protein AidB-like acyl-CoA dehydrogenase
LTTVAEAAEAIVPVAAAGADRGEQARQLEPDVVQALRDADLFRLCVPASLGGAEGSPRELVEAVETLARTDASVAWVLAVTATSGLLAAYLDEEAAREIYGSAGVAVGGVFAPRGRAVPEGEVLTVSGRWTFGTGSTFCDWLLGGCTVGDGPPRLVLFPRDEVEIHDTWTVAGLRATGSHDFSVDGLRVPADRAAAVIGAEPRAEGPLYAFPLFGLLALAIAGVTLGIARGALTDVTELASVKRPEGSRRLLSERATVQAEMARAEAALRAARALLMQEIDRAWELARNSRTTSIETRIALRLAATHAARAGRDVVDSAYDLAGGSALYESGPLARRFRDAHAASQHMLVAPATWELTGRLLLGAPSDLTQL